jgi:8-oxo-dGTP pyrophosphatase MutT (NUDIX family)
MHRDVILKLLADYQPRASEEEGIVQRFKQFVATTPNCFERTHEEGHITGSSFILSPDRKSLLLALHAKLQKWLQLGGHADGCPYVHDVALREAVEESGISKISHSFIPHIPIDFDIHEIPSNKKEKAHFHYDVRFIFYAHDSNFICSNESLALKWIPIDQVSSFCNEPSILRVIKKIQSEGLCDVPQESCASFFVHSD